MKVDLRVPWRVAVPLGSALVAGAVGIAAYTTHHLNGPMRHNFLDSYTFSPFELKVEHEPVMFRAADGVQLRGWWLPHPESRSVVIGCTGHRGAKHELLGIGSELWRAGHNVLLFDFRGRGESDSALCSLAFYEMADLRAAIAFAAQRVAGAQIGVLGYSMGAAVAILVTAEEPRVQAVVADSPFATMRGVVGDAYRRRRLPVGPILSLTDTVNRLWYGYTFDAVQPIDAVRALAPRPLLLIHGTADQVISVSHAHLMYAAAGAPKELWLVPDVDHCGAYFADRPAYVARVTSFFERTLGNCV